MLKVSLHSNQPTNDPCDVNFFTPPPAKSGLAWKHHQISDGHCQRWAIHLWLWRLLSKVFPVHVKTGQAFLLFELNDLYLILNCVLLYYTCLCSVSQKDYTNWLAVTSSILKNFSRRFGQVLNSDWKYCFPSNHSYVSALPQKGTTRQHTVPSQYSSAAAAGNTILPDLWQPSSPDLSSVD